MRNKIGLSQFYSSKELICPQSASIFCFAKKHQFFQLLQLYLVRGRFFFEKSICSRGKKQICPQSDSIFADKKVDLKHITM